MILYKYVNQVIQSKWNGVLSDKCKISNCIKQGGCLSPSLFSIYLNNLILYLRTSNIGGKCRSEYMGVFGYADDLSLLCPSFTGIKEVLNVCEKYMLGSMLYYLMQLKVNYCTYCTKIIIMRTSSQLTA